MIDKRHAPVLAALAAGGLGMVQILVLTGAGGVGVTPDSVDYLAGAMSLVEGRGYTGVTSGMPISHWPPLFSALLAGMNALLGISFLQAGRYLNAAAFGVMVGITLVALWRLTRSTVWTSAGVFLVLTAASLVGGAAALLTEPLFCLLLLAACVLLERVLATGRMRYAVGLGVVAALAVLQRYIGGFLIPWCAVLLASPLVERPWGQRVARAAVFVVVASAPATAWGWRNREVSGSFFGMQGHSNRSLRGVTRAVTRVTTRWLAPERMPVAGRAAVLAAVAGVLVWMTRRAALGREERLLLWSLVGTGSIYMVVVGASSLRLPVTLGERTLSPAWAPLAIAAVGAARLVRGRAGKAAMLVWLVLPAQRYATACAALAREGTNPLGHNYNDRTWRRSASVAWVRDLGKSSVVFSNAYDALWFHTGIVAQATPQGACPAGRDCYLVWYGRVTWRNYLPRPEQLATHFQVREIRRFPDATVYTVQ